MSAGTVVMIRPWLDPLVDELGHDPRSIYVEQFWLGVLGPTATWLLRRLVSELEQRPDGYRVDLADLARSMGLSYTPGRSSPFAKALQRCTMFGLAHQTSDGLAVRRRVPEIAQRHLRRLPSSVQLQHAEWVAHEVSVDDFSRAHELAVVMAKAGDETALIEHRLVALGVAAAVASEVADNVRQLR
ncbi:MAG: hypothetical protein ACE37B_04850 [Ilumatobacter sp.]|uniref:hypothetical protein n=1 Tax=Ilumatobacter sp. TaxID=1967498 RepID=UPI003918D131